MTRLQIFDEHRRYLFGLAYRMTGSAADAEDLVQDCWLRWQQLPDPDSVQSPRAFLTTALTRLCINHLQSAAVRREQYVGSWLPEPIPTSSPKDPAETAESLTTAFLLLLESLSPVERAVFLLAEVFGYEAEEIGLMVDKTSARSCTAPAPRSASADLVSTSTPKPPCRSSATSVRRSSLPM